MAATKLLIIAVSFEAVAARDQQDAAVSYSCSVRRRRAQASDDDSPASSANRYQSSVGAGVVIVISSYPRPSSPLSELLSYCWNLILKSDPSVMPCDAAWAARSIVYCCPRTHRRAVPYRVPGYPVGADRHAVGVVVAGEVA